MLFLLTGIADARSGIEEEITLQISPFGGKVTSPLTFSALYGSYLLVPKGSIPKKVKFSMSVSTASCPQLPKKWRDVGPSFDFAPTEVDFSKELTVHIAAAKDYKARKNSKSKVAKSKLQLWALSPSKKWRKVKGSSVRDGAAEAKLKRIDDRCFTIVAPVP